MRWSERDQVECEKDQVSEGRTNRDQVEREKDQVGVENRCCLRDESVMSPRLDRLDSLSILSRQSDLVRVDTKIYRYAAMLLMLLTLGVGQMWG